MIRLAYASRFSLALALIPPPGISIQLTMFPCENNMVAEGKPHSPNTVRFFLLTYSKSSGMHTYRMLFLPYHVTWLKKNGWPSVNNVTSGQSKEMAGQTSDVAVISC